MSAKCSEKGGVPDQEKVFVYLFFVLNNECRVFTFHSVNIWDCDAYIDT